MSLFEFIAGLYIVLAGLAVTLLMRSIGQMIESRDRVQFYWIHSCWLAFIFLVIVNSWFIAWEYRDLAQWTIGQFLLLVSVPTLLYLAAHVSVPEISEDTSCRYDMRAHYYERHRLLLGLLALAVLSNLLSEHLFVDEELLTTKNGIRLTSLALLVTGVVSRRPWVHAAITLAVLAIVAWFLGIVDKPIE